MLRAKLSVVFSVALLGLLALQGCGTSKVDETAKWSPNKIYSEAKDEQSSGGYDKAAELFEKLEGRAAGTPLAQQAQIERAYSLYKGGDRPQALATLDRFIKLNPASPVTDYALYLKGIINFNDDMGWFAFLAKQDLSERDQKAAKESFQAFSDLITRFPESRYAPDAKLRLTYIVNALASYEVHVARYYYSRGAYIAAISRAQSAITDYRQVPAVEEALYIVYKSYDALKMDQLRDDARRVLEATYPNSIYVTRGFRPNEDPWWKIW